MATNDVYQVVIRGTVGTFPMTNVFWYQQLSGIDDASNAAALANLFDTNVLADICALQHENCLWSQIFVVNMADTSDFSEFTPVNDAGLLTGDTSPNYVAFGYRLNRRQPGQRHGYKRFAGAPDANVNGNTWAPDTTARNNLTASLAYVLTAGDNDWQPCVVKHSDIDDPTYHIELGVNPVVQYRFETVTPLTAIRSQVSRRRANVN